MNAWEKWRNATFLVYTAHKLAVKHKLHAVYIIPFHPWIFKEYCKSSPDMV